MDRTTLHALALLAALAAPAAAATTITTVDPETLKAGSEDAELTLEGGVFTPSSVARWNRRPRPTEFISASKIRVRVPAADLKTPGTANVDVIDSRDGSESSNPVSVRVRPAGPRITPPATPGGGASNEARLASAAGQRRRIVFDRLPPGSELVISDLQGRVIATLPAPDGSAVWEPAVSGPASIRPGVYVYRTRAADGSTPDVEGVVSVMR